MENSIAIRSILCHCARGAPVHKNVAAREDLRASLGLREQAIRGKVSADKLRIPGRGVEPQDLAARCWRSVNLGTIVVLGTMGAVVVQADDFDVAILLQPASVVLEAKLGSVGHLEVRTVAVEAPDYGAVGTVDLVDGAGITSRNEVVALGIFVNAVDVEIVPRVGRIVARSSLARVDGKNCLCEEVFMSVEVHLPKGKCREHTVWLDMVETRPFKEQFSSRDVELYKNSQY